MARSKISSSLAFPFLPKTGPSGRSLRRRLVEHWRRNEEFDQASSRKCQNLIGNPAEVQRGNVDVGVSDDSDQSLSRTVLGNQSLDIGFFKPELSSLRAPKALQFLPTAIGHVASERVAQQLALRAAFTASDSLRFA